MSVFMIVIVSVTVYLSVSVCACYHDKDVSRNV